MQDTNSSFPHAYSLETPKGHMLQGAPSIRIQARVRLLTPSHPTSHALPCNHGQDCHKTQIAASNAGLADVGMLVACVPDADHSLCGAQYSPRAINVEGGSPLTGLAVLGLGGTFFGLMSPFMFIATSALATTNYWRILPYG